MDYDELLLAAAVRDLAEKLQHSAWGEYRLNTDALIPSDRGELREMEAGWKSVNPLSAYVPLALDQITDVAVQIAKLAGTR